MKQMKKIKEKGGKGKLFFLSSNVGKILIEACGWVEPWALRKVKAVNLFPLENSFISFLDVDSTIVAAIFVQLRDTAQAPVLLS